MPGASQCQNHVQVKVKISWSFEAAAAKFTLPLKGQQQQSNPGVATLFVVALLCPQ